MPLAMTTGESPERFVTRGIVPAILTLSAGELEIEQGLRARTIPLHALRYLWVKEYESIEVAELVLAYETAGGKRKRVRMNAARRDPALSRVIALLLERSPAVDLRDVAEREVWRLMGSGSEATRAGFLLPLALPLVVACFFLPELLHLADRGTARLGVSELVAGAEPGTSNLTLEGVALWSMAVERRTTARRRVAGQTQSEVDRRLLVPLVAPEWTEEQPVPVVVVWTGAVVPPLTDRETLVVTGIARDLLWEGLAADERSRLAARGLVLSPEPCLLEADADAWVDARPIVGVLAVLVVLAVAVGLRTAVLAWRSSQASGK